MHIVILQIGIQIYLLLVRYLLLLCIVVHLRFESRFWRRRQGDNFDIEILFYRLKHLLFSVFAVMISLLLTQIVPLLTKRPSSSGDAIFAPKFHNYVATTEGYFPYVILSAKQNIPREK